MGLRKSAGNDSPSTSTRPSKNAKVIGVIMKTGRGILLKGKSTPNLSAEPAVEPIPSSPTPEDPSEELAKQVKFTYMSPADRWRTRKQFCVHAYSTECLGPLAPEEHTAEARSSRAAVRKPRSGVTDRSQSRTQRLLAEQNATDRQDDVTKVFDFLTHNVATFQIFQPRNSSELLELSILQYFKIIEDIVNTFDPTVFRNLKKPLSLHAQNMEYSKHAMEVARKCDIKVNMTLLVAPMTQRPNCSTTKKKLAFLRSLVEHAEAEILKRRHRY